MIHSGRVADLFKGWMACVLCACLLSGCGGENPNGPDDVPESEQKDIFETQGIEDDTLWHEEEPTESDTVPEKDTASVEETGGEGDETGTETGTRRDTYTAESDSAESSSEDQTTEEDTALRLCGYTVDEIIGYFHEVVHSSEYSFGSGSADVVHRWEKPIYYQIHGDYTAEDMQVLSNLCTELNAVEGFPGMYPSPDDSSKNVDIYFYEQSQMNSEFGHLVNNEAADGLMTYWYSNTTHQILNAVICCRSDASQSLRDSVIVEEVVNMLGMPNDTRTRSDSILYQYGSSATEPSELDWLLIRLLYDEHMCCGYNCDATAAVIRQLCAEWA